MTLEIMKVKNLAKISLIAFTFIVFLFGCGQIDDPNADRKIAIQQELKKIKNMNIVFGVDKMTTSKKVITLMELDAKFKDLKNLNGESDAAYLIAKNYYAEQLNKNPDDLAMKNDSLWNEFLCKKSKDYMAALWKEKVYEGNELGNAYWLTANQIEQLELIKGEIDLLNRNR